MEPYFVYIFLFKLLLGLINFIVFWENLKNSAFVSKNYFLSKTFCVRVYLKSLQLKYSVCFIRMSVLKIISNIIENSLQMKTKINMLDQFHSSLYKKQLLRQEKFQKPVEISYLK